MPKSSLIHKQVDSKSSQKIYLRARPEQTLRENVDNYGRPPLPKMFTVHLPLEIVFELTALQVDCPQGNDDLTSIEGCLNYSE